MRFTLLEILIMVAIVGILTAIGLSYLDGSPEVRGCEEYADWRVSNLPARCLDYFKAGGLPSQN